MKTRISKTTMEKKLIPTTINLPKEWTEHLALLKKETGKSESFYIKKALQMYLEDLEDLQIGLKILKNKSKTYTTEELNKKLGL